MEKTLHYWGDSAAVTKFLPVYKEILRMPKDYVHTVLRSVIGEEYGAWVNQNCVLRNQKWQEKQNDQILIDPEIAEILQKSTHISSKFGVFFKN